MTVAGLRVVEDDGTRRLSLRGDLDAATAASLEPQLLDAAGGAQRLVLDLREVAFIDSAGVRVLDHVVAAAASTPLRVVAPAGGSVAFTLRLTGFRPELVAEDLESALRAVRGR